MAQRAGSGIRVVGDREDSRNGGTHAATEQLEQLIQRPRQPVREVVRWLHLLADLQIKHTGDRSTLYAHLSRMDVKKGQRILQGQRLGAVGTTGWSTGPHLHFEFRVAGQHQDPLRVAKASETVPLDAASRPRFAELVRTVRAKLDVAETLAGQRGQAE